MSGDELGSKLYQTLFGRRFLIVMDDMWSIDAWDEIQRFFPNNENSQRRVVIRNYTLNSSLFYALQSISHTRSIICESKKAPPCRNLGLLRIIHADDNRPYQAHIDDLVVNLRHLVVKVDSLSSFLSSINLFWNLRTLIVSCSDVCNAPVGIWNMSQFRHIEFNKRPLFLPDPPPSDRQDDVVVMENLQILKGLENLKFGDQAVERIPNIKKLGLEYDWREGSDHHDYHCVSNIKRLCKLESLYICCGDFRRVDFLYRLIFPLSLKSLNLVMNREFEWEEMLEKIASLPHLQKLKLSHGCFGTGNWEVVEGQFPCLKYLKLYSCRGLKLYSCRGEIVI